MSTPPLSISSSIDCHADESTYSESESIYDPDMVEYSLSGLKLSQSSNSIVQASDTDVDGRSSKINTIRDSIKELRDQLKFTECEAILEEHCLAVKNVIDLKTELLIESVRNESQKLVKKVDASRERLINDLSARFKVSGEQVTRLEKDVDELIKSDKPGHQVTEGLDSYIEILRLESLEIKEMNKKQNVVEFRENKGPVCLGSIIDHQISRLERVDLIAFFQQEKIATKEIESVQLVASITRNCLVLAYKQVNHCTVHLRFLNRDLKCTDSQQVKEIVDYNDFKLYRSGYMSEKVSVVFNLDEKSIICIFNLRKSYWETKIVVPKSFMTAFDDCRIIHLESLYNNYMVLCQSIPLPLSSSAISSVIKITIRNNQPKRAPPVYEEIYRARSMRISNRKLWVFDSNSLSVYGLNNLNDPTERIRGFPNLADIEVNVDNFLVDKHDNLIFFVGPLTNFITRAIYVNMKEEVVYKQQLYGLEIDDFFIDKHDTVHLLDAKQLVVYKFNKP